MPTYQTILTQIKIEIPAGVADLLDSLIDRHFDFHAGKDYSVFYNAALLRLNKKIKHYIFRIRNRKHKKSPECTLSLDEFCALYQFIKLNRLYESSDILLVFYGVLDQELVNLNEPVPMNVKNN